MLSLADYCFGFGTEKSEKVNSQHYNSKPFKSILNLEDDQQQTCKTTTSSITQLQNTDSYTTDMDSHQLDRYSPGSSNSSNSSNSSSLEQYYNDYNDEQSCGNAFYSMDANYDADNFHNSYSAAAAFPTMASCLIEESDEESDWEVEDNSMALSSPEEFDKEESQRERYIRTHSVADRWALSLPEAADLIAAFEQAQTPSPPSSDCEDNEDDVKDEMDDKDDIDDDDKNNTNEQDLERDYQHEQHHPLLTTTSDNISETPASSALRPLSSFLWESKSNGNSVTDWDHSPMAMV